MNLTERLTSIFRNVFQDDSIELAPQMTADDVEGWDSLSHVNLLIAIEIEFGFDFKQNEIQKLNNVGDLISCIEKKLDEKS